MGNRDEVMPWPSIVMPLHRQDLNVALSIQPSSSPCLETRGQAKVQLGDLSGAISDFQGAWGAPAEIYIQAFNYSGGRMPGFTLDFQIEI